MLNALTDGDTYTARFLNANPFEFRPEFKIFINSNHLPRTADNTVFSSGRVKIIPFERHFDENEQDTGLKKLFRKGVNQSAVLNWAVNGWRLIQATGFDAPPAVTAAIEAYRSEADIIGNFLSENTVRNADGSIATSKLYAVYADWAKANGYKPLSNKSFTMDLRRRFEFRHDCSAGNVIDGLAVNL